MSPQPAKEAEDLLQVLITELVAECTKRDMDQAHFILLSHRDNQRRLVVVCTTDQATEAVLEFLDSQIESGTIERSGGTLL